MIRDGEVREIPAHEVVLGDCILLRAGDTVIADGVVLEAQYLEMDEALLTGESDSVRRQAGDRLLSGSVCVTGEGCYRAEKVRRRRSPRACSARRPPVQLHASPMTRAQQHHHHPQRDGARPLRCCTSRCTISSAWTRIGSC